jgi:hypothetical protein
MEAGMRLAVLGLVLAISASGAASAQDIGIEGPPLEVIVRPDMRMVRGGGVYIPADAELPVAGVCVVVFDVTPDGRARWSSIEAQCDDEAHVEDAKELVATRRFDPPLLDGEPQAQTGVSLELRFRGAG